MSIWQEIRKLLPYAPTRHFDETTKNTNKKEKKNMKKNINRGDKITSTSDVTVDDIVNFVVAEIKDGASREKIVEIVKQTVRPCAIGGVPTVVAGVPGAGDGGAGVIVGGGIGGVGAGGKGGNCGNSGTKRFPNCVVPGCGSQFGTGIDGDAITKCTDKKASPKLAVNSEWYNLVLQNGELWTPYTSRRFLPAQYLHMMAEHGGNVDQAIARRYSLRDCFKLLDNEIEKLIFMEQHWRTAFAERSMFLSVERCKLIFTQYLNALKENVNDRSKCVFNRRKHSYWRKIFGEGSIELWHQHVTSDHTGDNGESIDTVEIKASEWLIRTNAAIGCALNATRNCKTYQQALDILRTMPKISMGTFKDSDGQLRYWLPKYWKEAFKKAGAYYTLKSLIVNKHVRYAEESGDWRHRSTDACTNARDGLNKLALLRDESVPAYVVHAILKKSIEVSNLNIEKFLRTIRKH